MSKDPQFVSDSEGVRIALRPEVVEAAVAMERKLKKNDFKTGWKEQPVEAHIKLMDIERMELDVALEFLTLDEACKELVDLMNFAMIIRDKLMSQGMAAFRNPPIQNTSGK